LVLRYRPFAMLIKPRPLFCLLVRKLEPTLILDVGSRDGSDALAFRQAAPHSRILSFEANPELVAKMRGDPRLERAGISTRHFAVSDAAGEATFRIFNEQKGMGSLLKPAQGHVAREFAVPTLRLDDVPEARDAERIALWIDVEGCSYQAIEGAQGILDAVILIHAEVERAPLWKDQKLDRDLTELLAAHGFVPLATRMKRRTREQGNVIYLREVLARRPSTFGAIAGFGLSRAFRKWGPSAAVEAAAPGAVRRRRAVQVEAELGRGA
jgi:FkbM family methyltransferase